MPFRLPPWATSAFAQDGIIRTWFVSHYTRWPKYIKMVLSHLLVHMQLFWYNFFTRYEISPLTRSTVTFEEFSTITMSYHNVYIVVMPQLDYIMGEGRVKE